LIDEIFDFSEIFEFLFPRKREDQRFTHRHEFPGLIKAEFTRVLEKAAHVEIATFQASVVNSVHN